MFLCLNVYRGALSVHTPQPQAHACIERETERERDSSLFVFSSSVSLEPQSFAGAFTSLKKGLELERQV